LGESTLTFVLSETFAILGFQIKESKVVHTKLGSVVEGRSLQLWSEQDRLQIHSVNVDLLLFILSFL